VPTTIPPTKITFAALPRRWPRPDEPRNRQQAFLDRWWQSERDFDAELNDTYTVGGFLERWSQTPSYTKGRRDRDWRIK
jgi:hypothetical protein